MAIRTVHEAAAEFAAEYERLWEKDCGRLGEARHNFQIRVWDGRFIVFRALTGNANGWHRCQRLQRKETSFQLYTVLAVFCVADEKFSDAMSGVVSEIATARAENAELMKGGTHG